MGKVQMGVLFVRVFWYDALLCLFGVTVAQENTSYTNVIFQLDTVAGSATGKTFTIEIIAYNSETGEYMSSCTGDCPVTVTRSVTSWGGVIARDDAWRPSVIGFGTTLARVPCPVAPV